MTHYGSGGEHLQFTVVGKPEVETPHPRRRAIGWTYHQQNHAQQRELRVKRLADDESAVASAPPPVSGRA